MKGGKHSYGWQPDIPDRRDFLYSAIRQVIRLPKKVDFSPFCSRVEAKGHKIVSHHRISPKDTPGVSLCPWPN